MSSGRFIVFEGGEGSGKSAHAKVLAERLTSEGHEVVLTREPGGSEYCQKIRQLILDEHDEKVAARTELFLFFADRAQHVESVILPALAAGKIVICDRYSGSTFAYQLGGRKLPDAEFVQQMEAYARANCEPELVLYLDVEPETGLQRRNEKGGVNRLDKETLDFHHRVREYFHQLAQNESWCTFSTMEGSKEENAKKVYEAVRERLSL